MERIKGVTGLTVGTMMPAVVMQNGQQEGDTWVSLAESTWRIIKRSLDVRHSHKQERLHRCTPT